MALQKELLRTWPAPKAQYAGARHVGVGQDRRFSTLHALSRVKQARFTI